MKSAASAMTFEDTMPLTKPSKLSLKKEIKRVREVNINQMTTGQIIWHLAVRHKFSLMTIYAISISAILAWKW